MVEHVSRIFDWNFASLFIGIYRRNFDRSMASPIAGQRSLEPSGSVGLKGPSRTCRRRGCEVSVSGSSSRACSPSPPISRISWAFEGPFAGRPRCSIFSTSRCRCCCARQRGSRSRRATRTSSRHPSRPPGSTSGRTWHEHAPSFFAPRRASPGTGSAGLEACPSSSGSSIISRRGTIARYFRDATVSPRFRYSPRCCTRCPCCTRHPRTLASTISLGRRSGSLFVSRPPSRFLAGARPPDRWASSYPPFPVSTFD